MGSRKILRPFHSDFHLYVITDIWEVVGTALCLKIALKYKVKESDLKN